ncbi:MAG TPA: hypothetical protein VFR18_27000 [Terriglobia bacterium]|nr:hypothetical protein [Terriglobia bacterium]
MPPTMTFQRGLRARLPLLVLQLLVLVGATAARAQVPAGVPYDARKHPNPIITWVEQKDFVNVPYAEAAARVGVELMSLSKEHAERTMVEVATPPNGPQKIRNYGEEYEATFYPVMRQTYKLKSGNTFLLYTFRFPRALTSADFLNITAFGRPPRGVTPRFGPSVIPDRIDIRGVPGLYFDNGRQRTIYWYELEAGHSVTTNATKEELFEVLKDLL